MTNLEPGRLARLKRARYLIDAVERRVLRVLGRESDLITFRGTLDRARAAWVVRVESVYEVKQTISLQISEAIHNLRASLDYVIRDLSVIDTGHDRFTGQTQFPICSNSKRFRDVSNRRLKGVSSVHRGMVERLQPYRRVMGSQPFWALRELERLSNQDKHRLLQVAVMSAAAADMYIEREPRACEIKDIAFRAFIQRPLDEGQEIMAVNLRNIGSDPEVYVKTNTAPYIGFSDGEDCVDLLRRVQGAVERAVMTFEPEFQNPQSVKTLDRVLRRHRRRPARTQNVGMLVRDREGRRLHRIWQAPERPQ